MRLIAYLTIKYLAYAAWCFIGLQLSLSAVRGTLARALGLGLLRLLLGLMFGVVIYLLGSIVYSALVELPATGLLTYLAVYVPVRWVEWSLIAMLIAPASRSFRLFWIGMNSRDRLWRCGGILVSCIADIPMIIALGGILPVGRFLC